MLHYYFYATAFLFHCRHMSNLALLERQLKDINDFTYDSKIIAVEIAGLALDDIAEKDLGM